MANKHKQKGTAYETDVVRYLQENGFPNAERRALNGALDRGDIAGVDGWVLECKNHKSPSFSQFVDEAEVEAKNAGTRWYAAIVKRMRKNVSKSYVVMPLDKFVEFLGGRDDSCNDD